MSYPEMDLASAMCNGDKLFLLLGKESVQNSLFQNAIVALVVSAFLLSLLYLFGILFRNTQFTAFVKYEMFELLMSGVILFAFIAILSGMCTIHIQDLFPAVAETSGSYTMWEYTMDYFIGARNFIIGWMTADFLVAMMLDQMASTTIYAKPLGMGVVVSPLAGLGGPIKQILYQILNALSVTMVVVQAQLGVLSFMFYGYARYYLPMGLLLRSFSPTRRYGGAILAIGIAFLVIFPILVTINFRMVANLVGEDSASDKLSWDELKEKVFVKTQLINDPEKYNEQIKSLVEKKKAAVDPDKINPPEFKTFLSGFTESVKSEGLAPGSLIYASMMLPVKAVAIAFIAAFLLPAVNLVILAQSVKSLSRTLGEEVDITILTRLI